MIAPSAETMTHYKAYAVALQSFLAYPSTLRQAQDRQAQDRRQHGTSHNFVFVFALAEGKNENAKKIKYRGSGS